MAKQPRRPSAEDKRGAVPPLALTHGQTLWLMNELGLSRGVSASTFNHYVKSLRKLGVPLEKGQGGAERRPHVSYDFEALMELTVALLLRVYGALPDAVVSGLREFRRDLRPIYRTAYLDSVKRQYPPVRISEAGRKPILASGVFVDLNVRYAAGQIVEFGPPKLVSPYEAARIYLSSELPARSYLPLNISAVAETIIVRTRTLPPPRGARRDDGGDPM
jgi:hypothetical protein